MSRSLRIALLDVLAAALAETGAFEEAVKTAEEPLALHGTEKPALAQRVKGRLALYKTRKPYRAP